MSPCTRRHRRCWKGVEKRCRIVPVCLALTSNQIGAPRPRTCELICKLARFVFKRPTLPPNSGCTLQRCVLQRMLIKCDVTKFS